MLRRLIGEDIELVTLPAPDLGLVKIDPGQFEQVVMNLAVNANDAMPNGGKLTIETANVTLDWDYIENHVEVIPGEYVMLAVTDTGEGIPQEVQSHIFEPFFTTKEVDRGTGLGLATCFGIVKQSNGHIWVYSEPDQGTTFKIYLPRVSNAETATLFRHRSVELPTGTETILLVEDEASLRDLSSRMLQLQGYTVLEAGNGDEALRVINKHGENTIDLVVTDVVMPQMGGKVLADKLKILRPNLKILFTSGYTDRAIVNNGVLEEGIDFLQKPFALDVLVRVVREILDKKESS
jgi:two-component system, cell cycle sensor histidine kinase and response regulator CckA